MSAITTTILTLLTAIRVVESCDGLDSRANGNEYQITRRCLEDVNRIYGMRYRYPEDTRNRETAENIILLYLTYYGSLYERDFGKVPSRETLAKIYHCGYRGFKRGDASGRKYWHKVEAARKDGRKI